MSHAWDAEGDGCYMWQVAVNMLLKQSQTNNGSSYGW